MLHILFSVYAKREKKRSRKRKVHYLGYIALCVRPSVFVRPFFFFSNLEHIKTDTARQKERKKRHIDRN